MLILMQIKKVNKDKFMKVQELYFYAPYKWFSHHVIAAMLVDKDKRFLISSFCLSTSNCTLQHCYLCPSRLDANHLLSECFSFVLSGSLRNELLTYFTVITGMCLLLYILHLQLK